jgi:PBSX family phage terminase large subunit
MPKARNPNREKAFEIYKKHKGEIDLVEIASQLNLAAGTVRGWKSKDKWDEKMNGTLRKNMERSKRKSENKKKANAEVIDQIIENPDLNDKQRLFCVLYVKCFNATKAYQKAYECSYETATANGPRMLGNARVKEEIQCLKQNRLNRELISEADIFQKYIDIAFADITDYMEFGTEEVPVMAAYGPVKVKNEETGEEETLTRIVNTAKFKDSLDVDGTILTEVKQGKDGAGIKLADRMKALQWLADHMNLATEEQRAKIEKTRADIQRMQPEPVPEKEYKGIPATMVAPVFAPVLFDIKEKRHTEYVFPGGRGSTKSSFVSLAVGDILRSNDQIHAVIMRQVGDTMRSSIYQQARWAIEALGLEDEFECTVSPLEITRKSTGQKIYFRGADDPGKVKSIKVPFGYIGVLWFEELDQFMGPEAVRKIEQSVIRGGDTAYIFKTFNPPKSLNNWANKYIKIPKETRLVTESTYLDIPKKWLGKTFIEEAEFLKETNPDAYENEYLGVANGSGGSVFDNITIREITDDEISGFDHVLNGIDWGWFPDLYAFARVHYDRARLRLYIWQEYTCNKRSNRQTADELIRMGITGNDLLTCDSAEKKSIGDYKSYGLLARAAEKGPGSREYSYKWLQSLREIIIDNVRCPVAAQEFMDYEYERDKEGNIITGYPDGNDHMIDAVRYATERIWKRRGE